MRASLLAKADAYRSDNVACAKKILEQPEHFGPAMVEWARLVLAVPAGAVIETEIVPQRSEVEKGGQGRLF
jgi:hypothetical protein